MIDLFRMCIGVVASLAITSGFSNNTVEAHMLQAESIEMHNETIQLSGGKEATLFIGDSRTVGMNKVCHIDDKESLFVMAQVGEGYDYLEDNFDKEIEEVFNTGYTQVNLVTNFGVNDIYNKDKYIDYYESIADIYSDSIDIYMVSVNPVEDCENVTNEQIEEFNSSLKDISLNYNNMHYVSTYDLLKKENNITTDGLHYKKEYYKQIYKYIQSEIYG